MKYAEFIAKLRITDKEQWESLVVENAAMLVDSLDNLSRPQ